MFFLMFRYRRIKRYKNSEAFIETVVFFELLIKILLTVLLWHIFIAVKQQKA